MCTRFALKTKPAELQKLLGLEQTFEWEARYNLAPSQPVPAVIRPLESEKRELKFPRWGFVQSWAQGGRVLVNARSEDIQNKSLFQESFEKWRCLIPMDGFYEWRHEGKENKPYFIRMKSGKPFGVAGLWAPQDHQKQPVDSCVVLTTEPNGVVKAIHDRMPVIIQPSDFSLWLDSEHEMDFDRIERLMRPFPEDAMEAYEVSRSVNDPQTEGPECIEPFANPGTLSLPF
jgi:putative SOS response-associated peptidase YedK